MDRATVKARREKLNMTQTAVATAVGLTRSALCRFESGDLDLSAEKLEAIATLLGIDTLKRARRDLRRHVEAARGALGVIVSKRIETMERSA
jgi:transcriptional regulator with XRE-family HTH domain